MQFSNFVKECREKEVFKMLSIYIVSSWVLIQVMAVVQEPLGLPAKSVSVLLILLLVGFPVYIFYIWKIRLAPQEKKREAVSKSGKPKRSKFEKTYFSALTVITMLSVLAATVVFNNNFRNDEVAVNNLNYSSTGNKIAVLDFHNNTGQQEMDIVGPMAADWILHGITENQIAEVVTSEVVQSYLGAMDMEDNADSELEVLMTVIKPGKTISGSYYVDGDDLVLQASIRTGNLDQTLLSVPTIRCSIDEPLQCIEQVKQEILGFLATENLGTFSLEQVPPKFKAYKSLLEAQQKRDNPEMYYTFLTNSIAEDPDYFEPKVLLVGHYYNERDYETADSLNRALRNQAGLSSRQLNVLDSYDAIIRGDNRKAYLNFKEEYSNTPSHLGDNATQLVLAVQYVNQPQDAQEIYDQIDMSLFDLENCYECLTRIYMQGTALIELGEYDEAIQLLTSTAEEAANHKRTLVAAYVRNQDHQKLNQLLEQARLKDESSWSGLAYRAAHEYRLVGEGERSDSILQLILKSNSITQKRKALSTYWANAYSDAVAEFALLAQQDSTSYDFLGEYALALYKTDRTQQATQLIQSLETLREPYQYGGIDYEYAQYYAGIGDTELALAYLTKSIADGNFYLSNTFHNDPHFSDLKEEERFQAILTYWQ